MLRLSPLLAFLALSACAGLLGLDDDASEPAAGAGDGGSSGGRTSSGENASSGGGASSGENASSGGGASSSGGGSRDGAVGPDGGLPESRAAFITEATVNGNFAFNAAGAPNAWEKADAICNQEAAAAQLPGRFVALISYAGHAARDRLESGVPFAMRYDDGSEGPLVAENAATLFSAGPVHRVDRYATGSPVHEASSIVWTGSATDGTPADEHCLGWTTTNSNEQAYTGASIPISVYNRHEWLSVSLSYCAYPHRLYCFEHRD